MSDAIAGWYATDYYIPTQNNNANHCTQYGSCLLLQQQLCDNVKTAATNQSSTSIFDTNLQQQQAQKNGYYSRKIQECIQVTGMDQKA